MDVLTWVQDWYLSQCDGDWEHGNGIRIDTLDNPGWSVRINLVDTNLEDESFEYLKVERTENDWMHCRVENGFWEGFGGPKNLEEMLQTFRLWAETATAKQSE